MAAAYPPCDIFIMVGEPSGDAYAADLVREIQARNPDLRLAAAGCEGLRSTGIEIDQDMSAYAVMGFVAVAKRIGEFKRLGKNISRIVRERKPKVLITVDYPGFNLRLLKNVKELQAAGTKFCHVVAPQVWAWKPRRAKKVAQLVDRLCCFFPFEPPLFTRHGGDAAFVGHPLVDAMPMTTVESQERLRTEFKVPSNARVVLLAPGSREAEVSSLLPIFDEALAKVSHRLVSSGPVVPIVAKSPHLDHALYRKFCHHRLIEDRYRDLLHIAHVGLIASGTATLEAALAGLPHVIAYKGDGLSAAIARQVILTDHVGLPNIVHKKRICPEVLQDQCEPVRLAAHLERLWGGAVREKSMKLLAQTREKLGGGHAMERIASEVLMLMEPGKA